LLLIFVEVDFDHYYVAQEVDFADFDAVNFNAGAVFEVENQLGTFAAFDEITKPNDPKNSLGVDHSIAENIRIYIFTKPSK
jgi:hypothetical protein